MAANDVKLLGYWTSPFILRVRIALNIKSISYEFLQQQFGLKSDLLIKSNPVYKKVPVLIHGDKPVCESLIIVEYVDEFWSSSGHNIMPFHPYDRAISRFWATYIDDKWFPSTAKILNKEIGEEERKEATEQVVEGLKLLEDAFKKCSNGNKFFLGDKIGYLDIALGSYLAWLGVVERLGDVKLLDVANTPNLYKWAQDFCGDSYVKDDMPDPNKLVEFADAMMATWK